MFNATTPDLATLDLNDFQSFAISQITDAGSLTKEQLIDRWERSNGEIFSFFVTCDMKILVMQGLLRETRTSRRLADPDGYLGDTIRMTEHDGNAYHLIYSLP